MQIDMYAGDDKTIEFTVVDESNNNQPLDLSGATLDFRMVQFSEIINKSIGSGITVVDAANGRANVSIDRDDTVAHLANGAEYDYEFQITTGGKVCTLIVDKVIVKGNYL